MKMPNITIVALLLMALAGSANAGVNQDSTSNKADSRIERLAAGEKVDEDESILNLLGPTSEQEHGRFRTEVAELPLSDSVKRGFRGTGLFNVYEWADRHLMTADPDFQLDQHFDKWKEGIPGQYWDSFGGVRSEAEGAVLHDNIKQKLADLKILQHLQANGYAAYMLGLALDLSLIITLLVARYARKNTQVFLAAIMGAFICEVLVAALNPVSAFGSTLALRVVTQCIIALIGRRLLNTRQNA